MAYGSMACGVLAVAIGVATWGPRLNHADGSNGAPRPSGTPVPVLVELFTSEGCSSCPPADTLLTRLATEKTIGNAEVVTLAFHVDYWNRLGWTDRFSSAAFTERQNRYATAWKSDRIYTPQAVVDGRVEFVGTDATRALDAFAAAIASRLQAADPADRVGFPTDYARFTILRVANITQQKRLGTVYANAPAAAMHDVAKLPYPNGSVIVMEWATPVQAADGTPVVGADGLWQKGDVVRLDVMRRQAGYGAAYGTRRAGEWEFASYQPDGNPFEPKIDASACASCHAKPGVARDFVFRGRFPSLDTM